MHRWVQTAEPDCNWPAVCGQVVLYPMCSWREFATRVQYILVFYQEVLSKHVNKLCPLRTIVGQLANYSINHRVMVPLEVDVQDGKQHIRQLEDPREGVANEGAIHLLLATAVNVLAATTDEGLSRP
jgi:hypothetical protein